MGWTSRCLLVWVVTEVGEWMEGRGRPDWKLNPRPRNEKSSRPRNQETPNQYRERKKERFYLLASYLSLSVVALASALGQSQVSVPQYQSAPSAYIIVLLAAQSSLAQVKLAGPLGHCLSCVVNHILFPRFRSYFIYLSGRETDRYRAPALRP